MSGIEIFDTEVFTGRIKGPLLNQYELEFRQTRNGELICARKLLTLSKISKFMVPLPAEIDPNGKVTVSLNEISSGLKNILSVDAALRSVFYHNLGVITVSPQPRLERSPDVEEIPISTAGTHFMPMSLMCLVLVVALFFSALRNLLFTRNTTSNKHKGGSPQKPPLQGPTDNSHSLAPEVPRDRRKSFTKAVKTIRNAITPNNRKVHWDPFNPSDSE